MRIKVLVEKRVSNSPRLCSIDAPAKRSSVVQRERDVQVKETQKQCLFHAQLEKLQQVKLSAVWILAIIIITNMAFSYQDLNLYAVFC